MQPFVCVRRTCKITQRLVRGTRTMRAWLDLLGDITSLLSSRLCYWAGAASVFCKSSTNRCGRGCFILPVIHISSGPTSYQSVLIGYQCTVAGKEACMWIWELSKVSALVVIHRAKRSNMFSKRLAAEESITSLFRSVFLCHNVQKPN